MAGGTYSFGAGDQDYYIVKLDVSGTLQWTKTVGGTGSDGAGSIVQTTDGGYEVAGYTFSFGAGDADMYIVKLDASGTLQWNRTVGGTGNDYGTSITRTTDGGYAVAGYTSSFGSSSDDFYIVKFDAIGNTCGNTTTPSPSTSTGGTLGSPTSTVTTPTPTVTSPTSSTSPDGTFTNICTGGTSCSNPPVVNAGSDKTIYLGYGVQNAVLTASVTGGTSPYSYLWSNAATTVSITVSPTTTTSYNVLVTDAQGCTSRDTVVVNVTDVRCGNNNNKVLVCHNGHTICVSPNAVPAHLNHGDYLGNCGDNNIIESEIPQRFALSQNYPNPFNPTTKIRFALPKSSFATLVIYDLLGRELETLVNEQLTAGTYEADWNGDKFASGVYYYKLTAGDFVETKKMVLIK